MAMSTGATAGHDGASARMMLVSGLFGVLIVVVATPNESVIVEGVVMVLVPDWSDGHVRYASARRV
jgi:hypothetical protein